MFHLQLLDVENSQGYPGPSCGLHRHLLILPERIIVAQTSNALPLISVLNLTPKYIGNLGGGGAILLISTIITTIQVDHFDGFTVGTNDTSGAFLLLWTALG